MNNAILAIGGVGFVGSNFVFDWITWETDPVVNLDKLTYAGDPSWSTSSRTASRE
jgi:dTDP-glucose 4,6-dehydratase